MEIFVVPVANKFLLYAPFHHLSALINSAAYHDFCQNVQFGNPVDEKLDDIFYHLKSPSEPMPQPRSDKLNNPLFLGLLPTRGCNMACRYCDFISGDHQEMSLETARQAVDAYLDLLQQNQRKQGAIHFFGGEPFHALKPVQFAVEYARKKAHALGIHIHFEATTNGNYDEHVATWIADNLNTVVFSLDGNAEVQNLHRPLRNGKPSFNNVTNSARILSDGDCELVIRSCVSNHNVENIPEIAKWLSTTFCISTVCFEPLSTSAYTDRNNLFSPNPLIFTQRFYEAAEILHQEGIQTVLSTADLSNNQISSCPVGKDALIVTPDGRLNACYLLDDEWISKGMDMSLGTVTSQGFQIDPSALNRVRQHSVLERPLCSNCFCRFSCAGGCHVHHDTSKLAGDYDEQCIRTRLVTVAMLLTGLGQDRLCKSWLWDETDAMKTALQRSDRIADGGKNI